MGNNIPKNDAIQVLENLVNAQNKLISASETLNKLLKKTNEELNALLNAAAPAIGILESLLVTIPKREAYMRKEYPAGTCNAEDAWSEFGKYKDSVEEQGKKIISGFRQVLKRNTASLQKHLEKIK